MILPVPVASKEWKEGIIGRFRSKGWQFQIVEKVPQTVQMIVNE